MAQNLKFGQLVEIDSGLLIPASAAAGLVLTSDASGNATWQSPTAATPSAAESFSVYLGSTVTLLSGVVVPFNTDDFDISGRVDLVTHKGRYTPKTAGYYLLTATVQGNTSLLSGELFDIQLLKNGSSVKIGSVWWAWASSVGVQTSTVTTLIQANGSTDYFEIGAYNTHASPGVALVAGSSNTYFSGHLYGH